MLIQYSRLKEAKGCTQVKVLDVHSKAITVQSKKAHAFNFGSLKQKTHHDLTANAPRIIQQITHNPS